MRKNIHPKNEISTFKCATCGNEYKLESTKKSGIVSIDVCSNCHSFYVGKTGEQTAKGRSEKLSSKFAAGKENLSNKKTTATKDNRKKQKEIITDLDKLAA